MRDYDVSSIACGFCMLVLSLCVLGIGSLIVNKIGEQTSNCQDMNCRIGVITNPDILIEIFELYAIGAITGIVLTLPKVKNEEIKETEKR